MKSFTFAVMKNSPDYIKRRKGDDGYKHKHSLIGKSIKKNNKKNRSCCQKKVI